MEKDNYISSSHDVRLDADYGEWLSSLKSRYQHAQIRAAVKVNGEKLLWNWQLGRDLVLCVRLKNVGVQELWNN